MKWLKTKNGKRFIAGLALLALALIGSLAQKSYTLSKNGAGTFWEVFKGELKYALNFNWK